MTKTFLALSLALALAACSKTDAPAPTLATAQSPEQLKATVAEKQLAAAPKGDPAKPLADYAQLDSGKQLRFAHMALSGLPVDYDKVAEAISRDYQQTQDAFKRKDIAAALKPAIDQEIAKALQSGYLQMEIVGYNLLEGFNFEKKTFAVKAFADAGSSRYFHDDSNYQLVFTNSSNFAAIAVPDEARARSIEGARSQELKLRVFMFMNGVVLGENQVRAQVMHIQLLDRQGNVLAQQ